MRLGSSVTQKPICLWVWTLARILIPISSLPRYGGAELSWARNLSIISFIFSKPLVVNAAWGLIPHGKNIMSQHILAVWAKYFLFWYKQCYPNVFSYQDSTKCLPFQDNCSKNIPLFWLIGLHFIGTMQSKWPLSAAAHSTGSCLLDCFHHL